jgi:hypothetical protein
MEFLMRPRASPARTEVKMIVNESEFNAQETIGSYAEQRGKIYAK